MAKPGAFSRSKGRRFEQQLVIYLKGLGFEAERILRQYQTSGQPDVKAVKDGKTYTFECKSRKCSFTSIYNQYFHHTMNGDAGGMNIMLTDTVGVSLSTELNLNFADNFFYHPAKEGHKVCRKLFGLLKWKQDADFLVIKDNNKPKLFLRYIR